MWDRILTGYCSIQYDSKDGYHHDYYEVYDNYDYYTIIIMIIMIIFIIITFSLLWKRFIASNLNWILLND